MNARPCLALLALMAMTFVLTVTLVKTVHQMLRWWTAQKGRAFVEIAAAALRELKSSAPHLHPPTHHQWSRELHSSAPVVCGWCMTPVLNDEGQFCQYCRLVAHHRCVRHVSHDCKPLALPGVPHLVHDWRPAGVVLPALAAQVAADGGMDETGQTADSVDDTPQLCTLCAEPCEVGLFAVEPVWVCTWCQTMVHVQCYVEQHPNLFTSATKAELRGQVEAAEPEPGCSVQPLGGVLTVPSSPRGTRTLPPQPPTALGASTQLGDQGQQAKGLCSDGGKGGSKASTKAAKANGAENTAGGKGRGGLSGASESPLAPLLSDQLRHLHCNICEWDRCKGGPAAAALLPATALKPEISHMRKLLGAVSTSAASAAGSVVESAAAPPTPAGDAQGDAHPGSDAVEATHWGGSSSVDAEGTGSGSGGGDATASGVLERRGKGALRIRTNKEGSKAGGVVSDAGAVAVAAATAARAIVASTGAAAASAASAGSGSSKWWAAATAPGGLLEKGGRWARFTLERSLLPTSLRPILVFINIKSGPQLGRSLCHNTLQLLHPLQVVELPREQPEAALRFFAHVPNLRVLVMGGDGTVGWILQCIDDLAASMPKLAAPEHPPAAAALPRGSDGGAGSGSGERSVGASASQYDATMTPLSRPYSRAAMHSDAPTSPHSPLLARGLSIGEEQGWEPPPLAVLPVGTGNDLARCLGWGGGLSRYHHNLSQMLHEVMAAKAVRIDRWAVAITPLKPRTSRSAGLKRLMRRGKSNSGSAAPGRASSGSISALAALAPAFGNGALVAPPPPPPPGLVLAPGKAGSSTKTLNNYLGIGIDAKVALEFHRIRDQFPSWFQSQLGNKVWYTGIGTPEVVRRSCAALHTKVKIFCDGVEVPIPPDAEGVVITNITSHMGGVFLWETGYPALPIPTRPDTPSSAATAAAALTHNRRQALADGIIEVVAIGGVAHMGRLSVGLARAQRLCQCSSLVVQTLAPLPMQVDGEPWLQSPAQVAISLKNQGVVLRRTGTTHSMAAAASQAALEVLHAAEVRGVITPSQRAALAREMGSRLDALL